jgi:hypothetical protein
MDFSMEDTQNSAPDAPSMAEVNKLGISTRKADTQSVTKRYVHDAASDLMLSPKSKGNLPATSTDTTRFPAACNPN